MKFSIKNFFGKCETTDLVTFTEEILNGKIHFLYYDSSYLQQGSPTCTKESMRLILTLLACNKWPCNAIDIKSAFLQEKQIERPVFLIPPPEFQEQNTVWKLKTYIYGLSDVLRKWHLRVKEELCKLGIQCNKFESSLFYYQNNNSLDGILITFMLITFVGEGQKNLETASKHC